MLKVIISGSREYGREEDYLYVKEKYREIIGERKDIEIVSGHAKGIDALGEMLARENGYKLSIFPADWNLYGKAAGPIRNSKMARYAKDGVLIAFPKGGSRGTWNMIKTAREAGLKVYVFQRE